MTKFYLSVNQLAEFSISSEKKKKSIIRQQKKPNLFKVPRYQLTKARIRKCIELNGDLKPIYEGLETLKKKVGTTKWQKSDISTSILALERFIKLKLPIVLKDTEYTIIRPKKKTLTFADVDIIVAPEIVVKGNYNGKSVIGGIKIHISKNEPFDYEQSKLIASTLYKFLEEEVASEKEIVLPELCFVLDVFGDRIVSAMENDKPIAKKLTLLCEEIKTLWEAA